VFKTVGVLDALALSVTVNASYQHPLPLLIIFHNSLNHDGGKIRRRDLHVMVVDFSCNSPTSGNIWPLFQTVVRKIMGERERTRVKYQRRIHSKQLIEFSCWSMVWSSTQSFVSCCKLWKQDWWKMRSWAFLGGGGEFGLFLTWNIPTKLVSRNLFFSLYSLSPPSLPIS